MTAWGQHRDSATRPPPRCSERKLMAARPDWVIGKRRFFLQWEDKPDIDCLEPRKIGPFF